MSPINITKSLNEAKESLKKELSPDLLKSIIQILITIIELLLPKGFRPTSQNSDLPPSKEIGKKTTVSQREKTGKKTGGQKGHKGHRLELDPNPDSIKDLPLDKTSLPKFQDYEPVEPTKRQVFDLIFVKKITEYRAETVQGTIDGKKYSAKFPEGINQETQYGMEVKKQIVYMSIFQMIPYKRIGEFLSTIGLKVSDGTIDNTLTQVFNRLTKFTNFLKSELINSKVLNGDETGISINGKNNWMHTYATEFLTFLFADKKRGYAAMIRAGILQFFTGILIHDHWKVYLKFIKIKHVFCNEHICRELKRVIQQTGHSWATKMRSYLYQLNKASPNPPDNYVQEYDQILKEAEEQCPIVEGQRKQSKERNLITRLREFKEGTLAFAKDILIHFTNNIAEQSIRMLKVKLKISGCFKTIVTARRFAVIYSYLATCRKNGISEMDAIQAVFEDRVDEIIEKIRANIHKKEEFKKAA